MFLFCFLVLVALFDVYWLLRLVWTRLLSHLLPSLTLYQPGIVFSCCWTTDIDYFFHMNNAKYFREMDFGRFDFYFRTGCSAYIELRPGMSVVQHGATIRYRRSINMFVPFKLVTRLVWWDQRSLYFEQSFVSLHDGFVRAIAVSKNTVVGGSVVEMLAELGERRPAPPAPQEVRVWIQSQELSSARLRPQQPKEALTSVGGEAGEAADDSGTYELLSCSMESHGLQGAEQVVLKSKEA